MDALIRQLADPKNTTVTAFVLDSVTARAEQVVRSHRDLVLANGASTDSSPNSTSRPLRLPSWPRCSGVTPSCPRRESHGWALPPPYAKVIACQGTVVRLVNQQLACNLCRSPASGASDWQESI